MGIKDLVKLFAQMSNLSNKQQEELIKILEQVDEDIDSIEDINDLTLDDIDFDEIDFDQFDLDKLGSRGSPGFGNDFDTRSADDFRYNGGEKSDKRSDIDINVSDDEIDESPYQGDIWVEVDGSYQTFVSIPEDTDEVKIDVKNDYISISSPIDKRIPISQLPSKVTSVEAELTKGNRLLIKTV
jgi:hypothetical protein